jgi:glycosyltransferase involved in cell wall biosynthesis
VSGGLLVLETHPVQYHAPVYRRLQQTFGVPVTAVYGSDFSVVGYDDVEFGARFAWDTDLLGGYSSIFLSKVDEGGPQSVNAISGAGIPSALKELDPRAILIAGYGNAFNRSAIRAARKTSLPLLFRGETTDHALTRSRLKAGLRDAALRTLYQGCAKLLYIGARSRRHFERLGSPPHKLVFSPYCVDETPFTASDKDREDVRTVTRSALGAEATDAVLLFSGKLSRRKGLHVLIDAVKRLPEALRAKCMLVFLGSGVLEDELRESAATPPTVRAAFVGFKNQRALSPYYHAADLLVLSSISLETWGLVVNEALHHGLPSVVTDAVGCAPDLIEEGKTGEIADAGSVESLTAAIVRGIDLTAKREVREACRAKVDSYSVHRAAEGIARAFSEV